MAKDLDGLIRVVYRGWKSRHLKDDEAHPDEEALVSFLEGKLSLEEAGNLKEHLTHCEDCAESVGLILASPGLYDNDLSPGLLRFLKEKLGVKEAMALEITLKFKDELLEVLSSGGEILFGQEMIPAALLRSRNISKFKDEVVILKDFEDIRIQVRIENKSGKYFNLSIQAKSKESKALIKDLRVALFKEEIELESYLNDSGSVVFEHVLLGKYKIELSDLERNLASVILELRA
jgi:hypothetical protein